MKTKLTKAQVIELILKPAAAKWGAGWKLISPAARQDAMASEILSVVLSQHGEEFSPAQDLIREVLAGISYMSYQELS